MADPLEKYRKRPARYSSAELEFRRREHEEAKASVRLSGGNPVDDELTELYLTGRVSLKEYVRLAASQSSDK